MNIIMVNFTSGLTPFEIYQGLLNDKFQLCPKQCMTQNQTDTCLDTILHLVHIGGEEAHWPKTINILAVGVMRNHAPALCVKLSAMDPVSRKVISATQELCTCQYCPFYPACESCRANDWDFLFRDGCYVIESEE